MFKLFCLKSGLQAFAAELQRFKVAAFGFNFKCTKRSTVSVVFIALVMLNGLSVAQTEGPVSLESEEVGTPIFLTQKKSVRVAFIPDGNTFYALSSSQEKKPRAIVSLYQLYPFKKIESFKMPSLPSPFGRYGADKVFYTKNMGMLIFYNAKSLMLFDFHAKKIVKKVEFENFSSGAVLENGRLNVFFKGDVKGSKMKIPYFKAFNVKDLTLIKGVGNTNKGFDIDHYKNKFSWITNISGSIVEVPRNSLEPNLVFYDTKTLRRTLVVGYRATTGFLKTSSDFKKLYVLGVHKVGIETTMSLIHQAYSTIEIDLKTKSFRFINDDEYNVLLNAIDIPIYKRSVSLGFSQSDKYAWIENKLFDMKKNQWFSFYELPNGEAALQNDVTKKIIVTPEAIKNLLMKNRQGKIVPLNDATLKK